ncbi:MAG: hypothetical protein GY729_06090 [Desulfobacteraceae bacterium]|nr:hypothetical protein [Desulfobacteraceae bacterium]
MAGIIIFLLDCPQCVVFEFLGNDQVVHIKEKLKVKALTNNPYSKSIETWKAGTIPKEDKYISFERFFWAADQVKKYAPQNETSPVQYAFDLLKSVEHNIFPYNTQWSIVYDIASLTIYFKTLNN